MPDPSEFLDAIRLYEQKERVSPTRERPRDIQELLGEFRGVELGPDSLPTWAETKE